MDRAILAQLSFFEVHVHAIDVLVILVFVQGKAVVALFRVSC